MQELIYYTMLYDTYGALLTNKQQRYFEDYYFKNMSLSELANKYEISRNSIYKELKESLKKLKNYENKLNLVKKNKMLEELIKKTEDNDLKCKLKEIMFL